MLLAANDLYHHFSTGSTFLLAIWGVTLRRMYGNYLGWWKEDGEMGEDVRSIINWVYSCFAYFEQILSFSNLLTICALVPECVFLMHGCEGICECEAGHTLSSPWCPFSIRLVSCRPHTLFGICSSASSLSSFSRFSPPSLPQRAVGPAGGKQAWSSSGSRAWSQSPNRAPRPMSHTPVSYAHTHKMQTW